MENKQIEVNVEKISEGNFLHHSFLDTFPLKEMFSFPKISVIIPTFDRCPYEKVEYNPLSWCIESLLAQEGGVLDEIVIIDDASTDYTSKVVSYFQAKSNISISYIKNEENKGSSKSRNIAVEKSRNEYILFLDDDCVASRYMLFGAIFTLEKIGKSASVLHLPIYHRKTVPDVIDSFEIGFLDLKKGVIKGNFEGFPNDYIDNIDKNLMDPFLKILKPIQIKNMAGVFLIKKSLFNKVGRFPEFFTWKNGYREETDLALRISENGDNIYFTPDPKFHCVHLKYGAEGKEYDEEDLTPHLRDLIKRSNISRINTGNRVGIEEWFYDFLLSTYVTLKKRSPSAAKKFLYETYKSFVVRNKLSVAGIDGKIESSKIRRKIFYRAVRQGDKLVPSEDGNKDDKSF